MLDWLIRPFPNSQEGNGLPAAVTKKPRANKTSCLYSNMPRSLRTVPAFTVVLLKFAKKWEYWAGGGGKKSGDSFYFKQQIKTTKYFPKSEVIKLLETNLNARAQIEGRWII